jgi:hypothetical protein
MLIFTTNGAIALVANVAYSTTDAGTTPITKTVLI